MAGRNPEASETPNLVMGEVVFHPPDARPGTTPTEPIHPTPAANTPPATVRADYTARTAPPRPRRAPAPTPHTSPLVAPLPPRPTRIPQTAVAPRPTGAIAVQQPRELEPLNETEAPVRKSRGNKIFVLIGAVVIGGGIAVAHNMSEQPEQADVQAIAQPNAATAPDAGESIITIIPSPAATPELVIPEQPTTDPTAPSSPDAKAPTATSPSTPKTTGKKSTPNVVVPPVATTHPHNTTPAPTHNTTPTPSKTTPEQAPRLATAPNGESLRLLSNAADNQKAEDLKNNYQNVSDYLRAPQSGELDFLSADAVRSYQGILKTVYGNQSAHNVLGDPRLMDQNSLANSGNPAPTVVSFSDNALRHAAQVFQMVGDNISKTAYLNNNLSDDVTRRLQGNEDISVPDSSNETIVGDVRKVHNIAVVPVVAEYNNSVVLKWEALVPVDSTGKFIAVTVYEKALEPNNPAPFFDTSTPTTEPTTPDTSTPESTPSATTESDRRSKFLSWFNFN